jgi:hypothetical protein
MMTNREDFTDAEWKALIDLPVLAAFGAMVAQEDSGLAVSTHELWAAMQELALTARSDFPDNALIRATLRSITHNDDGSPRTIDDWRATSPEALHEEIVEKTLVTASEVQKALAKRATPEEAFQYKGWVTAIAEAGVNAAKTGFLGLEGAQVTPREALFINELAAALGAPHYREPDFPR